MKTITSELRLLIEEDYALIPLLVEGTLNLTALSKRFRPLLAARCKKAVTHGATLMALSRVSREIKQKSKRNTRSGLKAFEKISVQPGLVTSTFTKTHQLRTRFIKLLSIPKSKIGYLGFSEGVIELTIISSSDTLDILDKVLDEKPISRTKGISGLIITHSHQHVQVPGLYARILTQLAHQGVNLIDLTSTAGELVIYLRHSDIQLAFDTLFGTWVRSSR